jgi:ElaB/YqjD/DUF883 family membrane-anchored ribosome-binding protein
MITAKTYDKDLAVLRDKIARLQAELSEVIGALGQISGHGLEDLREEAAAGAANLKQQGRQVQSALSRSAGRIETTIEDSIRTQPVLTIALATAAIALLLSPLLVRR